MLNAVRKGLRLAGPVDAGLIAHLGGAAGPGAWSPEAFEDPVRWALGVLGFADGTDGALDRRRIQNRFRELARERPPRPRRRPRRRRRALRPGRGPRILLAGVTRSDACPSDDSRLLETA